MFTHLPTSIEEFNRWPWEKIASFYADLQERPLTATSINQWLADWSKLSELLSERAARLRVATTQNTHDDDAEAAMNQFLDEIFPNVATAENALEQRLLESGLEPDGMAIPLRNIRADAELFREENLPLISNQMKRSQVYNRIIGSQTVAWEGEELTLTQLATRLESPDRDLRERGWRLSAERRLEDREALNNLWTELLPQRHEIAQNAGFPDFRGYTWQQKKRFDYTPADAAVFHQAIADVVVPAASRVYERYKQKLGIETLRPWDVSADVFLYALPALRPFANTDELAQTSATIFRQVDPVLGDYFDIMRQEQLLDMPNRKGKAPGAYCTNYPASERPFIFMNSTGTGSDIRTLFHEAGHAFHNFERNKLPYQPQKGSPMEFNEVASMAMELLTAPYITKNKAGFFTKEDADSWFVTHLEKIILFWPYMAVVDAFQHWAYLNLDDAVNAANCDAKWRELWQTYLPQIDFSGFEDVLDTGWHRKQHIFRAPFYYIEYGLAQLGALQIWRNAMQNQAQAVEDYRLALAQGGTQTLPALYQTANVQFAYDHDMVSQMIALLESQIARRLA
ncbi:MAG: M3 family oligoendopeptidase [Anaerolineales bacterium]|nr:M3 family oligoendopeptidase [Anaerolineales bacterium]MCB8937093.1 M3 family oligoendopeptidase [Ardenticatenaceae bacterium]